MDQHLIQLVAILTGLMLFSYWLVYCFGTPLADDPNKVDVRAIFSFLPYYLAQRRLKMNNLLSGALDQWREARRHAQGVKEQVQGDRDFNLDLLIGGRFFFTWERSLLCPVCLHWWLTCFVVAFLVGTGFIVVQDFGALALIYLVNHLFIRKI